MELQPIDAQTSGPQLFYGLRYHTRIVKPDVVETFHDQVGYWLWEPATGIVLQTLAIAVCGFDHCRSTSHADTGARDVMEPITRHNLIARLLDAVPEFQADPEDVRGNLTYLVFDDLARFVGSLIENRNHKELLQRVFGFIEDATRTRDHQIREILRDSFNELAIQHPETAESYMDGIPARFFS